jgi:hypothetical protein
VILAMIKGQVAVLCGVSLLVSGCSINASRTMVPAPKQPATASTTPLRDEPASEGRAEIGQELIGKRCRVRFRRDVLGIAGQAYIAPDADSAVPGKPLYVEGTVQSVTPDAIVLRGEDAQLIWVPMNNVLMVETAK